MPTYVYRCAECDTNFEAVQKFSDNPLTSCPQGHEGVKRVITPAGIIFKGSGWYIKDSKTSGSTAKTSQKSETAEGGEKSESKESTPTTSSTDSTKPSDPKPAAKTEAA